MKVLFINPRSKDPGRRWPPLDLLNYAAAFPESEILDLRAKNRPLHFINQKIKESDIVYVTSSPLDRWQCPDLDMEGFISFVNSLAGKEKICLLGVLPSLYPEKLLRETGVNGALKELPEGPLPAYHKIDLNDYYYELMGGRFAVLETARGCPYQCAYCFKAMYGDKVIKKSMQKVKAEIDLVAGKLKAENLYFIDLEFTLDRSRVMEIAEYILNKGYRIRWCCQTRADAVDKELLELMKRSGCRLIHFGVESGSQRVLDATNKRISLEGIRKGIRLTKSAGIKTAGFFMFGLPGETKEEMEKTIRFAKEIDVDYASFHAVIPYPGTMITEAPDKLAGKMAKKAYLRFYLGPKRLFLSLASPRHLFNQVKLFYNFIK